MSESGGVLAKIYDDIKEHGVPRWARRQLFVVTPIALLWLVYIHYFEGKQFQEKWADNLNAFVGPILLLSGTVLLFVVATVARLARPVRPEKSGETGVSHTPQGGATPAKNVTFSQGIFDLLGRFFHADELSKLRQAVEESNQPNELRLVGLLSMNTGTTKLETLSKKYHLGQVYFLWMCKTIGRKTAIRLELRINPYGAWTTQQSGRVVAKQNADRNKRYLGISAVWSIATQYELFPSPLVSEDLRDRDRVAVAKVALAISEFTSDAGATFPMGNSGHAYVTWLTQWRRGISGNTMDAEATAVNGIAESLVGAYRAKGTEITKEETLALLYLLCIKFSGSSPRDIAEAVVAYCRLGENSILIECVKNKYFLDAHAALAKMAKEKFPTALYFNGVPSCGLNLDSKYMKGVKDSEKMLTVHDLVQDVWHAKLILFDNFREILSELFHLKTSSSDGDLDAVISREAALLNRSISQTVQLYASA